jgi:ribosome-associated protein
VDDVTVSGPILLGAFLKLAGVAGTGGHAKVIIQSGGVTVNGDVETRRGRTLQEGDVVASGGREFRVWSSQA